VIVDRLTKIAHFIRIKEYYRVNKLAELYMDNILRSHGAPRGIGVRQGATIHRKILVETA
jgi:hypothetical protein